MKTNRGTRAAIPISSKSPNIPAFSRTTSFANARLTARDRPDDQVGLLARSDRIRQRRVGVFMREVLLAGVKTDERPALVRDMIAGCTAEHWIFRFERVEYRPLRHRRLDLELDFACNSGE